MKAKDEAAFQEALLSFDAQVQERQQKDMAIQEEKREIEHRHALRQTPSILVQSMDLIDG